MGLRMVRQPSETPNVSNIDDIIPFRYAYGDQNGYVIGRGLELKAEPNYLTFRINSGRVVLNGVETEVDPNGVSLTIDNASEKRYYSVYYEVNLATQTTAIKLSNYSINGYPVIESGDDLTINPSGIAKLELYRFTATNGVISDVEKVVQPIEYSGTALVGYDIAKGTVETRLSDINSRLAELGFKQGSIGNLSNNIISTTQNIITKQGTYVIGKITGIYSGGNDTFGIIPNDFLPSKDINLGYIGFVGLSQKYIAYMTISKNGKININVGNTDVYSAEFEITFGYDTK